MDANEMEYYDELDFMEYMNSRSVPIVNEIRSTLSIPSDDIPEQPTSSEITAPADDKYYVLSDYL